MVIIVSPKQKNHAALLVEVTEKKVVVECYARKGKIRRTFRLPEGVAAGGWQLSKETLREILQGGGAR